MDFGLRLGQQLRHVNGPRRVHELKDRLKDWVDERNESPHLYLSVSQEMKYVLYNILGISVPRNGLVITFIAEVVPHHSALVGLSRSTSNFTFFWYHVSKRHVHNFGNLPCGFILLVKLDAIARDIWEYEHYVCS
jgi:hypothetical protein